MPYKNKADRKYVTAAEDPERAAKIRARAKEWRAANSNEQRAKANAYYAANFKKIRAANRARLAAPNKPDTYPCKVCAEIKPYTEEHFNYSTVHKWKLRYECRECAAEKSVDRVYLQKYGITYAEAIAMKQRGCEVCGSNEYLAIDHCHTKGHIRGVLCQACNTALGSMKEDPERIKNLMLYAQLHR